MYCTLLLVGKIILYVASVNIAPLEDNTYTFELPSLKLCHAKAQTLWFRAFVQAQIQTQISPEVLS